jgi:Na+-transporting methylmalonyl-CoA/oxaloacetate decarboxylase gamma subunit
MNKKVVVSALVIIVAATVLISKRGEQSSPEEVAQDKVVTEQKKEETQATTSTSSQVSASVEQKVEVQDKKEEKKGNVVTLEELSEFKGLDEKEKESLIEFSRLMQIQASTTGDYDQLVKQLKEKNLKPRVMNDGNQFTGEMTVVRTDSTIPGARYFHAQYFDDENGKKFIQHLSFEIKPSHDSFEATKYTIAKTFGIEGTPKYEKDGYILWDTKDGKVLWVKKLEAEDLKNVPFNAYDASKDVGTIRVATELEIHDHAPHSHIEHVIEEGDDN